MPMLALALLLACASPATAMVRMAIFIGNNTGLENEKPLQYATRDAQQVHAVMLQLGGVDKGREHLLLDPEVRHVMAAFAEVRRKIADLRKENRKVQLLIYYSGHGSGEALHVNGEKLPLAWIREAFGEMDADLKILVADACFSGSLIQTKGAALAEAMPVVYQDELTVNGSAIITSSSAGELSQESKALKGSLFTHHFLSAIRGAGDDDRDGAVTLWEAYNHTQANLRRVLATGSAPPQNPAFDVDLKGSKNVILTRVNLGQAILGLKGLPMGRYYVMEAGASQQVAEVNLTDPGGPLLALPKAAYLVYHGIGGNRTVGFADLRKAGRIDLGLRDFHAATPDHLAGKGVTSTLPIPAYVAGPVLGVELEPRIYSRFPGREGRADALELSLASHGTWAAGLSLLYLAPSGPIPSASGTLEQDGYGFAVEALRRIRIADRARVFLGPRLEAWSLGQTQSGEDLPRGRVYGSHLLAGLEKALAGPFHASLSAGGGLLWSADPAGRVRRTWTLPLAFSLGYSL